MKKICKYFFVFFLSFTVSQTFSQQATLKGKAEGKPGELIRVMNYKDLFSHLPGTLFSGYTDSLGNFDIKVDVNETEVGLLALGLKKDDFYLKPGATYSFFIPLDTVSKRGSVFDELPLQFSYEAEDDGLMENIGAFNQDYNEFVINNTNRIYRNRDKKLVADFGEALIEKYQDVDNEYLQNYIRYTIAQLEWISKIKSDEEIIEEYFLNQPVLYNNIQYADFFNDFFKARLGATHLYDYDELVDAINSSRGYIRLDQLLLRSEFLAQDKEVRELVAVLLLAKKYYNPDIKKQQVIGTLKELERNSQFVGVENVAANFSVKLQDLAYGTPAPRFTLTNLLGDTISLDQLKGKFILLNFTKEDCKLCLHYLQDLEQLKKEFNGKLEIVTIVKEDGFVNLAEYAEARAFEWPVLNLSTDILLLESYSIRAFPSFLLINPDLTMALAIAPLPEEGLNLYIKRYMNKFEKEKAETSQDQ